MNSKVNDIKIDSNFDHLIDSAVQTNISGIITDEYHQKWKLKASKKLCLSLIWSFLENCFVLKRHYNEETYDISQLIYLTSAKSYILIREFLPLPSFQKLYLKYGDELKNEKKNIEDLSMVDDVIMRYKLENNVLLQDENESTNQIFAVTLAIDAFAFKSFSTTALTPYKNINSNQNDDKKVYNNGFLFMMIPVDFRYPSIVIHIEKESAGNYNENIDKIAKYIKITLICNGFNVWFKATDGDRYPSQEHIHFFNNHIAGKSGDFLKLVNEIFNELVNDVTLTIPIGDPFHLFKALRSRYQIHPIKLYADSDLSTNYEKTESILEIGQALSDITHLGKMRDCYCIKLFTLENVVKLLKAGCFVDSAFIFPVACWIVSIFSTKIDLSFRLFFTELAFQMFSDFHNHFTDLKKQKVFQRTQEVNGSVTIHEEQYIVRILNTLVASAVAFIFSDFIRTDGLGTHLVENQIGIARQNGNDPRWTRILAAFAHACLRKKIAHKYDLSLHIQGRINDGGIKINEKLDSKNEEDLIAKPENWSVSRILQLFHGICIKETSTVLQQDLSDFIEELQNLGPLIKENDYDVNPTANNGIIARLISFTESSD